MSGRETRDAEMASRLWEIRDKVRAEAQRHRERAARLDIEAERLSKLAAAVADGRPLGEALA